MKQRAVAPMLRGWGCVPVEGAAVRLVFPRTRVVCHPKPANQSRSRLERDVDGCEECLLVGVELVPDGGLFVGPVL